MELEERFQFRLLVRVVFACAKHEVEELRDGPGNGSCIEVRKSKMEDLRERDIPKMYIIPRTRGAHAAPIESPYLTLTACGMILVYFVSIEDTL